MKKYALIFALAGCLALSGCKGKEAVDPDLSSTHTTAAGDASKETLPGNGPQGTSARETTGTNESGSANPGADIAAKTVVYTDGGISIEYPVVENLSDKALQTVINDRLKSNALSVVEGYGIDKAADSLSVTCKILSADRRRLTAVYTGTVKTQSAAYPVSLFYTNTVDMARGTDIGFSDYSDPYTMASYTRSADCKFDGVSASEESELKNYKNTQTVEYYTDLFSRADFPVETPAGEDKTPAFPESFSYESKGNIYFSIPVPHALGDYAVIKYTPDTK